jgi:Flp pilus assembly protein TadG
VHRLRNRGERGTTLLLFPAAVLVVMLLSAIAVDMTQLHTAQVDLDDAVHAAADDGAAMIDIDLLRSTGQVAIDLDEARRTIDADLGDASLTGAPGAIAVTPGPRPGTLRVSASRHVRRLFGSVLPGIDRTVTVSVTVVAEIRVH